MTYHPDCTLPTEFLDQLVDGGLDALPEAMRLLINAAMLLERQQFIGAGPYQRTPERQAHANGFKDKTLQTPLGSFTVDVPQVREGSFYPQSLDKGIRSERAQTGVGRDVCPIWPGLLRGYLYRGACALPEVACDTAIFLKAQS